MISRRFSLLLLALTLGAARTWAITVTESADSGAGSLRDALTAAAAAPGTDSITFDPVLSGQTITLSSELAINDGDGVTVDASALPAGITLTDTGNVNRRLVTVSGGLATLRGLRFANGGGENFFLGGAGISNAGNLILEQCSFTGNIAGSHGGGYLQRRPFGDAQLHS